MSLFLTISLFTSCSNDDVTETDLETEKLDLSDLNLEINLEIGKEKLISEKDVSSFVSKNYDEILKLEEGLTIVFNEQKGKTYYSLNDYSSLKNKIKSSSTSRRSIDPVEGGDTLNCTTCTNSECVKNTLVEGIGNGDKDVYISVKPNRTLGVRTSISVCYGSLKAMLDQ